jgi:DNA-binding response OmpR family regulator
MIASPVFPDLSALVIDESLYIPRIVRDMLMRTGIRRVQEAPDGAEGLSVLVEGRPDLIILDWDLGILTG